MLTSLYPGITVMLARVIPARAITPAQRAGLGTLAIIAIALN